MVGKHWNNQYCYNCLILANSNKNIKIKVARRKADKKWSHEWYNDYAIIQYQIVIDKVPTVIEIAGRGGGVGKGGSVSASSFRWFPGGFEAFLLVEDDFRWFLVICCFSNYTNFTTYRRVDSLLYSWSHGIY